MLNKRNECFVLYFGMENFGTRMIYKIRLSDGLSFPCLQNESILHAATRVGIHLEHSCKDGRCGVCKTKLLSGQVNEVGGSASLTEDERARGFILTCSATPNSDLAVQSENLSRLEGIETKVLPCRIDSILLLDPTVITVVLRLPPNAGFNYLPGQYVDVLGPGGVRRSYSIASTPGELGGKIELLIRYYPGGVMSEYWFSKAKVDDLLRLEGPQGTFFLRDTTNMDVIFLATGTGIAPVKAMVSELVQTGEISTLRSCSVFFGCRTQSEMFFDASAWFPKGVAFVSVYSQEAVADREPGYIQDQVAGNKIIGPNTRVYACGSNAMIKDAKNLMLERSLDEKNFYSDAFLASETYR